MSGAVQGSAITALNSQRILRVATAAGNQMLAGSRVCIVGKPSEGFNTLTEQLQALRAQVQTSVTGVADESRNSRSAQHATHFDFVFTAGMPATATQLATAPSAQLPPLYIPVPAAALANELTFQEFQAAFKAQAAAYCAQLTALGFIPVAAQRADILEFAITGNTKVPGASRRFGERLAVVTAATETATGGEAKSRLNWAARGMPVTAQLAAQLGDLSNERILVSLILEPKTAALAVHLQQTGAQVAVFAPVCETDPTVAHELAGRGITVFAPLQQPPAEIVEAQIDQENAAAALAWGPTKLIDDGSHLIRLAHTTYPETFSTLTAASEETTSGVRPLQEMQSQGTLRIPVVAANNARTKTLFDNRVGTGESCVFALLATLDLDVSEIPWVIWGYGPVGEGVARSASAFSSKISVIEPDPVRALQAIHDGFSVTSESELPDSQFIAVSATGVWHTIRAATILQHWDTMILAVAGGVDNEIALDDLAATGWQFAATNNPHISVLTSAEGKKYKTMLLAGGAGINYTAGEGNPLEVMDLSFGTQLAALKLLQEIDSKPIVHDVSGVAESKVATAALEAKKLPVSKARVTRVGGAATPWQQHRYRPGNQE